MYKDLFGNVRPPPRGGGREAARERKKQRNREWMREKRRSDPEWRARENQRDRERKREKRRSDPEWRERVNQRDREWYREKRRSDPEFRARENQRKREKWRSDPEFRARENQRKREWNRENREWKNAWDRERFHRQGGRGYQKFRGQLVMRQNFRCANPNCTVNGGILTEETAHVDHIVPVSKWPLDENGERLSGLNDASNLQVMHAACNISKHATPMDKWARNDDA